MMRAGSRVRLDRPAVQGYLDGCIRYWRRAMMSQPSDMVLHNLECLQSVREVLLGERLAEEEGGDGG